MATQQICDFCKRATHEIDIDIQPVTININDLTDPPQKRSRASTHLPPRQTPVTAPATSPVFELCAGCRESLSGFVRGADSDEWVWHPIRELLRALTLTGRGEAPIDFTDHIQFKPHITFGPGSARLEEEKRPDLITPPADAEGSEHLDSGPPSRIRGKRGVDEDEVYLRQHNEPIKVGKTFVADNKLADYSTSHTWKVNDWWRRKGTKTRKKIIKIKKNDLIVSAYYNKSDHGVRTSNAMLSAMDRIKAQPCTPPTPDFMTSSEMQSRMKIGPDPLENERLAIKLSIENHKRKAAWVELLGEGVLDKWENSGTVCALCYLDVIGGKQDTTPCGKCFLNDPSAIKTLDPSVMPCANEWRSASRAAKDRDSKDFIEHTRALIARMEERLVWVNSRITDKQLKSKVDAAMVEERTLGTPHGTVVKLSKGEHVEILPGLYSGPEGKFYRDNQGRAWKPGQWFQTIRNGQAYKVEKLLDDKLACICYNKRNFEVDKFTYYFKWLDKDRFFCDPPAPDLMTAAEMKERMKTTGDPLKDKKLALELSIENHKRRKAWFGLTGAGIATMKGPATCALCYLYQSEEGICPLKPNQANCHGGCCSEWHDIQDYNFAEATQVLIKKMQKCLAEVEAKKPPTFKVGDWIIHNDGNEKAEKIDCVDSNGWGCTDGYCRNPIFHRKATIPEIAKAKGIEAGCRVGTNEFGKYQIFYVEDIHSMGCKIVGTESGQACWDNVQPDLLTLVKSKADIEKAKKPKPKADKPKYDLGDWLTNTKRQETGKVTGRFTSTSNPIPGYAINNDPMHLDEDEFRPATPEEINAYRPLFRPLPDDEVMKGKEEYKVECVTHSGYYLLSNTSKSASAAGPFKLHELDPVG